MPRIPGSRLGETPNGGGLVREFTLPKMAETFKLSKISLRIQICPTNVLSERDFPHDPMAWGWDNELPRFCHWNPGGVDPKA